MLSKSSKYQILETILELIDEVRTRYQDIPASLISEKKRLTNTNQRANLDE